MLLNHHTAAIIPYIRKGNDITFLFEEKDLAFKAPFFDSGLNGIGGHSFFSDTEPSPYQTVIRELREEFCQTEEAPEKVDLGLSQTDVTGLETAIAERRTGLAVATEVLVGSLERARRFDTIKTFSPPVMKEQLSHGHSDYLVELRPEEASEIVRSLQRYEGVVSPENLKFGGKVGFYSLNDINRQNRKFAYGYDHQLNLWVAAGLLPGVEQGVLRTIDSRLVDVTPAPYCRGNVPREMTFKEMEMAGLTYRRG